MTKNKDVRRILGLPVQHLDGEVAAKTWTERLQGRARSNEMPLWPIQGEALEAVYRLLSDHIAMPHPYGAPGALMPIGVGWGKTLITLLLPQVVKMLRGSVRPMLIVPPDLVGKTRIDHGRASRYYHYPAPNIVSMGVISHMHHSDIFERNAPDLIIVDEAHKLASTDSTRTRRLIRWVTAHPETICIFLSGTLTDKSIRDYRHLAELALRHMTPIPDAEDDLELWCSLVDVGGQPTAHARRAVQPLVRWHFAQKSPVHETPSASRVTPEVARAAYRARLRSLPGVVGTDDASCKASLLIRPWRIDLPDTWVEAAAEFTDEGMWEMPEGEEVVDAFAAVRARRQLSSGYYTRWIWPSRPCPGPWREEDEAYGNCVKSERCLCEGTGVWEGEDHEWLHHRREWFSTERHILKGVEQKTGQDSPALIRDLTLRDKFGPGPLRKLQAWLSVRERYYAHGRVEPPMEYVDLSPGPEWLAEMAKEWGRVNKRGLIWYATPHVGRALGAAGFRVFGAGTELGDAVPTTTKIDLPCAKIDVQGTGKNLQAWSKNLVLEFGGSGRIWEQFLGRTHRPGQRQDEVSFDVLTDGGVRTELFASAKIGARYIQETVGSRQRLCYATYLPALRGKYVGLK